MSHTNSQLKKYDSQSVTIEKMRLLSKKGCYRKKTFCYRKNSMLSKKLFLKPVLKKYSSLVSPPDFSKAILHSSSDCWLPKITANRSFFTVPFYFSNLQSTIFHILVSATCNMQLAIWKKNHETVGSGVTFFLIFLRSLSLTCICFMSPNPVEST